MSDVAFGRLRPSDSASEFNAISFIMRQMLGRINCAAFVEVKAVTNSDDVSAVGYVDVLPLVNLVDGQGNPTEQLTVYHLPYFRVQGGVNAVICDPKVGDTGLVIFCDRDTSAAKRTKAQSNPGSNRRFSMSDGFYIGGFLNDVPQQWVRFITDVGIEMVDINGNKISMNSNGVDVTAPRLTCTGEIIGGFGGVDIHLTTHTHGQPVDSHEDTEEETFSPTPGS